MKINEILVEERIKVHLASETAGVANPKPRGDWKSTVKSYGAKFSNATDKGAIFTVERAKAYAFMHDMKEKHGIYSSLMEAYKWVKASNMPGHLKKIEVPDTPAQIAARQAKLIAKRRAMEREMSLKRLQLIRPSEYEWDKIPKILKRTSDIGLGGEIIDIVSRKHYYMNIDGVKVAALKLGVYVSFNLHDLGYGKDDIEKLSNRHGGGEEGVSDVITITLYRDPKRPRFLKGRPF